MKKKKNYLFIGIALLLLFAIFLFYKTRIPASEIVEVKYSTGGGYGTVVDAATKYITITSDCKVKFSNSYDSTTEVTEIEEEEYKELINFISKRSLLFFQKIRLSMEVMDGYSSSLEVKLSDGTTFEVSGYMISSKKFTEIKDKIYELIDVNRFNEYKKNIGKENIIKNVE